MVTFNGGKTVSGAISGLGTVTVTLGAVETPINLTKTVEARFEPPPGIAALKCTVVATRKGVELKRESQTIALRSPAREAVRRPIASAPLEIQPPSLAETKVERQLPSKFSDVAVAGGGRFLIFHLPSERRLAVFDMNAAEFVHSIPLPDETIKFAGSRDRLIVLCLDSKTVQRWNLTDFTREAVATLPFEKDVRAVAMGSASDGPLLLSSGDISVELVLVDIDSFQPLPIKVPTAGHLRGDASPFLRASADGTVFGSWCAGTSPEGISTFVLEGNKARAYYQHETVGHVTPGPDGNLLFTAQGLFTNQGKPFNKSSADSRRYCTPADQTPYYLCVDGSKLLVCIIGGPHPLLALADVDVPGDINAWGIASLFPVINASTSCRMRN